MEKLLLKAVANGHPGAKKMLDQAREAGILRPSIPKTKPMNSPNEEKGDERTMNPVSYSPGYDPTQACANAADKEECLRLKNTGL